MDIISRHARHLGYHPDVPCHDLSLLLDIGLSQHPGSNGRTLGEV
jgi:hypothetical protein